MRYTNPEVVGFSISAFIKETGPIIKINDLLDPPPHNITATDPAYQSDE